MAGPTREFWQERFRAGNTPWDRGIPHPQLAAWLASGALTPCRILVPGFGSGYEVLALAQAGFAVTGVDYAPAAQARTRNRLQHAGLDATLITADMLEWQAATPFAAVYEQTCLCALHPDQWQRYAQQVALWLQPGGALFGLFMQALRPASADGLIEGPPYHCDINAIRALFPEPLWSWLAPPYVRVPHPMGYIELAIVLRRTPAGAAAKAPNQ